MTPRKKRNAASPAAEASEKSLVRCAVYCRKSTSEGLDRDFSSIDAQREAGEAYIRSQAGQGWVCLEDRYDDGGFTGANIERPAFRQLMADIEAGKIDCVVVYKIDRLTRSLSDFSRVIEVFDKHGVSLVSVTQSFDTSSSMGRLTLHILLSFSQFEREMISERTRDKMLAARKKGKWAGGPPLLGYDVVDARLVVNEPEAQQVRELFRRYLEQRSLVETARIVNDRGWTTKSWVTKSGVIHRGRPFTKDNLYAVLKNVVYSGKVKHKDQVYPGEHRRIVDRETFEAVQALLNQNGRSGPTSPKVLGGGVLSGLLRCRHCGCALSHTYTAKGPKRYRYYVCGRAAKRGYDQCPNPSVPAQEIEAFVVDEIRQIGRDPDVLAATFAEVERQSAQAAQSYEDDAERLTGEIRALYAELSEVAVLPDSVDRLAEVQRRIDERQGRLTETRERALSAATERTRFDDVARALESFDPVWKGLTVREQNELLRQLLSDVQFDGAAGDVTLNFRTGLAVQNHELQEVA